jgi:hypothetical protein
MAFPPFVDFPNLCPLYNNYSTPLSAFQGIGEMYSQKPFAKFRKRPSPLLNPICHSERQRLEAKFHSQNEESPLWSRLQVKVWQSFALSVTFGATSPKVRGLFSLAKD